MSSLVLMQLDVLSGRSRNFQLSDWLSGFWPAAAAGAGLVVLGWLAVRWANRAMQQVDPGESDRQMLQALEELKQGGKLSDGEFRLIKGRLANRLSNLPLHPASTEKTAGPAGGVRGLRRMESEAESVQSAQPSKPTNIRGSDLNPGQVSEEH